MPSLILLEDNTEVLRFPPINYKEGKMSRVITYKEKELIQYFDLEKRFLATTSKEESAPRVKKQAKV